MTVIVIDHCNSGGHTSTSYLCVDNISILSSSEDWTTTNELTNNQYFLTGMSALSNYQVQVQPVNNDGGNWSSSLFFSTNNTILGDANSDNKVTITDAVGVVNAIQGNPSGDFNAAAANINGDVDEFGTPQISITDAVGVVNMLLDQE